MLNAYPMQSKIVAINIGADDNEDAIAMVFLRPGQLAQGSAELIEWRRTLARPIGVAERSTDGSTANIGVVGKGTESGADIVAWASYIPYTELRSYLTIERGARISFELDLLHLWAIDT